MTVDFYLAELDRLPSLVKTLTDADGNAISLASGITGVVWNMYEYATDTQVIDDGACVITAPASNGIVRYDWTLADSEIGAGFYYGRFTINYSDGRALSVPNSEWVIVKIAEN